MLCVEALESALDDGTIHMTLGQPYGRRIAPAPWYPKTWGEFYGQMKACLAAGFPFVFGFTVYEAFESAAVAKSGVLNMPEPDERVMGGHAVMAAGYDDSQKRFIIRNSWGMDWGRQGYFTMPYGYLDPNKNLADDFWTIRASEEG